MLRFIFFLFFALFTITPPVTAFACDENTDPAAQAQCLYDHGAKFFKAKNFPMAKRLFEKAFALDPAPRLRYNVCRATEELGEHRKAIDCFKGYSTMITDPDEKNGIRLKILVIEDRLPEQVPRASPPPPEIKVVAVEPPPLKEEKAEPPPVSAMLANVAPPADTPYPGLQIGEELPPASFFNLRKTSYLVASVGAATAIGGGVLMAMGSAEYQAGSAQANKNVRGSRAQYDAGIERRNTGAAQYDAGSWVLGTGLAVVATGVAMWIFSEDPDDPPTIETADPGTVAKNGGPPPPKNQGKPQ